MSLSTVTGTAYLRGTLTQPYLWLRFPFGVTHALYPRLQLQEWVKNLPGRAWDPEQQAWIVTSLGIGPDEKLAEAGIELELPTDGPLAGIERLDQLYAPMTKLDDNGRTVLVRARFAGYEGAQKLLGNGAAWDKERQLLLASVTDVYLGASPRPGIIWDDASVHAGYAAATRSPLPDTSLASAGAALANAVEVQGAGVADAVTSIQSWFGGPVGRFGVDLYPYQVIGAYAVAAGHGLLADSPGVGKSFTALAASAVLRSQRVLISCPPVVLTNWGREVIRSGLAQADEVAVFRSGRKEPSLSENTRFAIISDSMLSSRPGTAAAIAAWLNDAPNPVFIVDEAHRMKTMGSARSTALLNLRALVPHATPIAVTGTPVLASPHELVPILEFTGHLAPVFGGAGEFLTKYCRQDQYHRWHPRKASLTHLNAMLNEHVWVRRTKQQVLPQLPERAIHEVLVDVSLAEYRKTHKEIVQHVKDWIARFKKDHGRLPNATEQEAYAQDNLRFVAQLRQAAGLAKVSDAIDMVAEHIAAAPDRPMLVWAHHKAVVAALRESSQKAGFSFGVIDGSTSDTERTRLVDEFQAGAISVLVLSITAAGVGITLTRSSDVLFVEADWTPAIMLQAIDRVHRIGQVNAISVDVLLAPGTLDDHVQAKLAEKGETLTTVLGDSSNQVAVAGDRELVSPRDIILAIVQEALGMPSGA